MMKMFPGDAKLFNVERQNNIEEIAMDSMGLYFMESLGCLEFLRNCNKIYINYEIVTLFSHELLIGEDEGIRKILHFIKTSSNIVFAIPSETGKESISQIDIIESRVGTFSCMLNTSVISKDYNATHVYLDMVAQPLGQITKADTISLFGFLKSSHSLGWLTDMELGKAILRMSEFNFTFLNVDSLDLYYSLQSNDFIVDERVVNVKRKTVQHSN